MRTAILIFVVCMLICALYYCDQDTIETHTSLLEFRKTKYFDSEIFTEPYFRIYGKWKVFDISGGLHGSGYDLNFDYLEVKEYGMFGFVRNDSLLEYGKIVPSLQTADEIQLNVSFEKDENSNSFFGDREKYVVFSGNDTLSLYSPCCDRFNYHFVRIK